MLVTAGCWGIWQPLLWLGIPCWLCSSNLPQQAICSVNPVMHIVLGAMQQHACHHPPKRHRKHFELHAQVHLSGMAPGQVSRASTQRRPACRPRVCVLSPRSPLCGATPIGGCLASPSRSLRHPAQR